PDGARGDAEGEGSESRLLMPVGLKYVVMLFGAVCIAIGMTHILIGPSSIPGSVPVNATMDSEDRFYATLFVGFGAALSWCARDLGERGRLFLWLMVLFFCTGLARLVSIAQVGLPHPLFQFLGAVELFLPLILWFWHHKAYAPPR
ncbi:MAG: DUF4345 domain-containing protein, partial [Sphingorhabdus sp.]